MRGTRLDGRREDGEEWREHVDDQRGARVGGVQGGRHAPLPATHDGLLLLEPLLLLTPCLGEADLLAQVRHCACHVHLDHCCACVRLESKMAL